jgi:hypothetical protein
MFIFHLEYFSSRENFCNFDENKYFFQNKVVMHLLNFLLKKLMEPSFSDDLILLKNQVTYSYSFIKIKEHLLREIYYLEMICTTFFLKFKFF